MLRAWLGGPKRFDPYRVLVFLGTVWGLAFIILMVDTNLSKPNFFDQSDYVMTFYVAGHLVTSGQDSNLYPTLTQSSFAHSPFDRAAHLLLPKLPEQSTAVFMYTPLVAWIFAPLSKVSPNISLLIWQTISILSLVLSAVFLSRSGKVKVSDILFLSALFFPIIATLWAGQVSLVIGLLPLSGGYLLFIRGRPFFAGLVWAFLSLKPQLVFVPAFLIFALAFARRFECCAGFVVGVAGLIILNMTLVPMAVTLSWLHSLQLGETFFSKGDYKIRDYLITSLPANILLALPAGLRTAVKWPLYGAAATLWVSAAWYCRRFIASGAHEFSKMSLILTVAVILLPITSPYLLYYDLCIFLVAGTILFGKGWPASLAASLKRIGLIGWAGISIYMIAFMTLQAHLAQPFLLHVILIGLFVKLIGIIDGAFA